MNLIFLLFTGVIEQILFIGIIDKFSQENKQRLGDLRFQICILPGSEQITGLKVAQGGSIAKG